ncbi:MAG: HAD-IIB family hydrolase [Deltaproteobacteria bacterium]|nr:HAD-IIB family hydrolase [Deltaproteobacteria bacterium]
MTPFSQFPDDFKKNIQYVLTDIDDTLTNNGRLPAVAYTAMEQLQNKGIRVIPITGRPAGWCDHIARMWPVDGLVGENGAFYFHYDTRQKKMLRRYWKSDGERKKDRQKLEEIKQEILDKIPACRVASDQAYREADLAIDFCEDVPPIPEEDVDEIVGCFTRAGARAKISSIHVNGWFGDYDKLTMTRLLFEEVFSIDLDRNKGAMIFSGDSPNDAPMFEYFPHSVGVANVLRFRKKMDSEPSWVTEKEGGYGFAEMVNALLS